MSFPLILGQHEVQSIRCPFYIHLYYPGLWRPFSVQVRTIAHILEKTGDLQATLPSDTLPRILQPTLPELPHNRRRALPSLQIPLHQHIPTMPRMHILRRIRINLPHPQHSPMHLPPHKRTMQTMIIPTAIQMMIFTRHHLLNRHRLCRGSDICGKSFVAWCWSLVAYVGNGVEFPGRAGHEFID